MHYNWLTIVLEMIHPVGGQRNAGQEAMCCSKPSLTGLTVALFNQNLHFRKFDANPLGTFNACEKL